MIEVAYDVRNPYYSQKNSILAVLTSIDNAGNCVITASAGVISMSNPVDLIDKEEVLTGKKRPFESPYSKTTQKIKGYKRGPVDYFDYFYTAKVIPQKFIAKIARTVFQLGWRVKVSGLENIPKNEPIILMTNHLSHLDAPIVGAFACRRIRNNAFHGIGDEKGWHNRSFRKLAKMINVFPVRRGTKNMNIVKYAIQRSNKGESMLWFPEGKRHKNPSENKCYSGKLGSGMLAHATNVPVIPSFLSGTEFAMPVGQRLSMGRGPRSISILVKYGKAVPLGDLRDKPASREVSQKVIERIMEQIEKLRPKGPYRSQSYR